MATTNLLCVTVLLLVSMCVDRTQSQCPGGCYCQTSTQVSCVNNNVCPQSLPAAFTSVSLTNSNNCGSQIDRAAFSALTSLTTIRIAGFSGYQVVMDHAFADTQLSELTITDTPLQSFYPGSLSGLSKLTTLDLSNNAISVLPDNLFQDLGQLTRLLLHSNKLAYLSDNIFTGLSKLTTLDLTNNSIGSCRLFHTVFQPRVNHLHLHQKPADHFNPRLDWSIYIILPLRVDHCSTLC